jgi:CNT family concentrative nucleoside transporter
MERLISLLGLFVMIGLAWLMSSQKKKLSWRIIAGGLLLQLALGAIMLRTPLRDWMFEGMDAAFKNLDLCVSKGAGFVFADVPTRDALRSGEAIPDDSPLNKIYFAFRVLPTIIVFSSLMSILYYLGIMQRIVKILARLMQATLGTSGAESLAASANIFVGHTEAPLVVRPYINGMTNSELNAMMVGGFATVTGGLLAVYHGMGINTGHLVTASVISAPAALLIAKVMLPEQGTPETLGHVQVDIPRRGVNLIEAASLGATDGMKLAVNVAVMLIAFLAIIAMINALAAWVGSWFGMNWSLEAGLGYLFMPLAWIMGIETQDCYQAGQLLGLKMVANEIIAYGEMGTMIQSSAISERSESILIYALSGFSNFGAIGIQIGGIGGLVPDRRTDLAKLGLRAMIGGALACCMTACVAGILI